MKLKESPIPAPPTGPDVRLPILGLVLALVLAVLFKDAFKADLAHFANDGPLGAQASRLYDLPGAFFGIWSDIYWVGAPGGNYTANFTGLLLWLLGPIAFNKFVVPTALLLLGLSAGAFFRSLGFRAMPCVLGGVAAALNSNFLSNACWGLPSRALSLAAMFLALWAAQSSLRGGVAARVIKIILAGLALGMSVSEGGDNGAIFSLFFSAYYLWMTWKHTPAGGNAVATLAKAGGRLAVIAAFALVMASQIVDIFFGFTGAGIAGTGQQGMSPEQKWSWATQWSLPKSETLRVVVPGIFGYRLDTPKGGNYWGAVGQDPAWETTKQGFPRHSGAGEYAGVLVVLVAVWALAHSFVAGGAFNATERNMIRFWGGAALLALVLSWGRHAPLYQFIYALPYFSTIRNPMKFMHPCHMALMILFAYGVEGLCRRFLSSVTPTALADAAARAFDRRWLIGAGIATVVAVFAFFIFASSGKSLANHIAGQGFDPQTASEMARFAAGEAGWSVFFLVASVVVLILISKGTFTGQKAKWAGVAMGLILLWDLGRANTPWIQFYNYKEKYASNGVFETLAKNSHEHRIAMPPLQGDRNFSIFQQIFAVEWLQHQVPYFDIQSLDQPQEPRMPADKQAYREALASNLARLWELTSTRFICGMAGPFVDALNQQLDPASKRFRLHTQFSFFQGANGVIGARVEPNAPFALVEFTGALPKAALYSAWETSTNEQATLTRLADASFDPRKSVIISGTVPAPAPSTNGAAGTVEFTSYAPKQVELKAVAAAPSVLLLNDKFDAGWRVWVNGSPAEMLRCNFLMRGVRLEPGTHSIVFKYQPQSNIFFISLGATIFGLALCVALWFVGRKSA